MCVSVFSRIQLCDPMDHSSPGSSVHGEEQEYWGGLPCPSRGSSQPRDQTLVSCIAGRFFTGEPPGKPHTGEGTVICRRLLLPKVLLQQGGTQSQLQIHLEATLTLGWT